jgi:hypothetical protein
MNAINPIKFANTHTGQMALSTIPVILTPLILPILL